MEFPSTPPTQAQPPIVVPPPPPPPRTPPRVRTPSPPPPNLPVIPQRIQQGRGRGRPHSRHSVTPYRVPPHVSTPGPSNVRTRSQLAGIPSGIGLYTEESSDEEI